MKTQVIEKSDTKKIIKALKDDQVVAFPTETVFGLGVSYGSRTGLNTLFELKNRGKTKAITLMLNKPEDISKFADIGDNASKVIKNFMPGKITIVLNKLKNIDEYFTCGKETIGIRIPDDKFILDLINETGPLLVTSANLSGDKDLLTPKDVQSVFDGKIPLIVNADAGSDLASTVVDLSNEKVIVLRNGSITKEMLEGVLK